MGIRTGKPRGRPSLDINDLPGVPGSKEFGDAAKERLALKLLRDLPLKERSKLMVELTKGVSTENAAYGAALGARLQALKYINEITGVVTQEKGAEETAPLPQIVVFGEPEARPTSVDALKLLATAKGSQYDETFPSSPPDPQKPPQPFKSAVTVQES